MLGINVTFVIKAVFKYDCHSPGKSPELSVSISFFLCVNDIFYVPFISGRCKLSEIEFLAMRERDHCMYPFLCLGTGFLLAGLDPLIACSAMLLVDNDIGRG